MSISFYTKPAITLVVSSLLLLLLVGCTEEISNSGTPSAPAIVEHPAPPSVSLDQVVVRMVDGIPQYENTAAYLQALEAVNSVSPQQFNDWAAQHNLRTLFHKYEVLLDRLDLNPDKPWREVFTESEQELFFADEDRFLYLDPAYPCPKLTNEHSMLIIGADLHYFSPTIHVVVKDGNEADIAAVLNDVDAETIGKEVLVEQVRMNTFTPGEEKIQNQVFGCPLQLASSEDRTNESRIYADYLCCSDLDIPLHEYQGTRLRQHDMQRVGCNGKRCRQWTFAVIAATTYVTELQGSYFNEASTITYNIVNRRKKNAQQKTWVDVVIEPQPFNPLMRLRIETSYRDVNADEVIVNTTAEFNVRFPYTTEQIESLHAIHHAVWTLGTTRRSIPYRHSNVEDVRSRVFIESGSIGHRWTNRGNDPVNDPIAVYFICQ